MSPDVQLRELAPNDLDDLQAVFERSRDHYVRMTGRGPPPDAASRMWDALPPGAARSAKLTLGVHAGGLVGVADVVRGWPRPGTWLIGLLLLDPAARRRGLGSAVVADIDARAARAGADRLRVGVVPCNEPALAFWRGLGFADVASLDAATLALERPVGGA